ncbi:MAG: hydantoinase/oxoprolinase family protein [Alphaproteobacteria bacterium]|nr:hydantoinase/oxoprolinase family protein [Alphaproteobacteria bacterium]
MIRLSVDIGGTFTDVVLEGKGNRATHKVLSTPDHPEVGAMQGITELVASQGLNLRDVQSLIHGTTLATNALIERKGARVGFVTTAGFRDVLEMRNEKRFDQYNLDIELPKPLVPRELRIPLRERTLADGSVLQSPDPEEIDHVAQVLKANAVEAVAIGLMHSYVNAAHEQQVGDRLRRLLDPQLTICLSSDVSPEAREYDRFSTVCANAYVRPLMSRYLGQFRNALKAEGFAGSFLMMLSGGGVTTLEQAMKTPIRVVESGPAGGVALAAHVAGAVGSSRTLALDLGGTTAKICFLEDSTPQTTRKFEVARAWRDIKGSGLPVRVPTIELVEIGAGGGSIARVDTLSRLSVGPESAGASPGPCAYGRGGSDVTLTDSHIALGNIVAEGFAGGSIALDTEKANEAIEAQIAQPMNMRSVHAAAAGVIEMADEIMANAARVHGLELGKDISEFDLIVSGGGGALHATRIAEKLSIDRIFVPENAGVGSAVGFLHAPVSFELAKSVMRPLSKLDPDALATNIRTTRDDVLTVIGAVSPDLDIDITAHAELRYVGQGQDLRLEFDPDATIASEIARLETRFHEAYRNLYGFIMPEMDVELFSFSLSGSAHLPMATNPVNAVDDTVDRSHTERQVYDLIRDGVVSFDTIERASWVPGKPLSGPAIVTEAQTTTIIREGWCGTKLDCGHLLLERVAP